MTIAQTLMHTCKKTIQSEGEVKSKGPLKTTAEILSDASLISSCYEGLTCDRHGGAGAVNGHSSSREFPSADANQSASGPHAEDGADGEVRVDDRRSIERVERHGVSLQVYHRQDDYSNATVRGEITVPRIIACAFYRSVK